MTQNLRSPASLASFFTGSESLQAAATHPARRQTNFTQRIAHASAKRDLEADQPQRDSLPTPPPDARAATGQSVAMHCYLQSVGSNATDPVLLWAPCGARLFCRRSGYGRGGTSRKEAPQTKSHSQRGCQPRLYACRTRRRSVMRSVSFARREFAASTDTACSS